MNIAVVSYSLTGNNEALAKSIAEKFKAEHIKVTELKNRTMGKIVLDLIFKRTPPVQPTPDNLKDYDTILFVAPVWMGQVATPLRTYLNFINTESKRYAFISISGGAKGPNPKLSDELLKRAGKEPFTLLNLFIADLSSSEPKPTRDITMEYLLNEEDVKSLTETVVKKIQEVI